MKELRDNLNANNISEDCYLLGYMPRNQLKVSRHFGGTLSPSLGLKSKPSKEPA
jgi:hypothetical protein